MRKARHGGLNRISLPRQLAWRASLALAILALAALLAGCGGAGAAGAGGATTGGVTHSAPLTPVAPHATLTPHPQTPTITATGGAATTSCPGPTLSVAAPSPTLIVTQAQRSHTITAQVGAVIEIRLPAGADRWQFDGKGAPTLAPLTAQGAYVAAMNSCVWDFTAARVGTDSLGFVGQPNCAARQPCPQYALLVSFTFSVT